MDLCFAKDSNHQLIQQLYPVYQFQVNVDCFQLKNEQNFNFSLEKLENVIQLRISDIFNQSRMFLCTIDNMTYHDIKTEQSLQVDFQGFIDHLMTILDSCRKNEIFISLVQTQSGFVLQFYERRSLKNLVHLFLRVQEAPPVIIMYHLNQSIANLKEEVSSANGQNKSLQNEINKRDFHIQELQTEVEDFKGKLAKSENMILHRNTEEVKRLNQEIKQIETAKEFEENRLKTLVRTFEVKVDEMNKENYMLNEKFMLESKKYDSLKHEHDDLKKKLNAMSSDNNRLQSNLNQFDGKDKQQRMKIDDLSRQMAESLEKLRSASKEKANLQAELEAEKQICNTKKRALQIATDELAKNHETIRQHARLVEKLKKGIEWRTLVMMRMNDENQNNLMNVEQYGVKQN